MSRKPKIEVIKIETDRPSFRPKRFPSQPRMYLELIENKAKIKQDLVNKEHISRLVSQSNYEPVPEEVEVSDVEIEVEKSRDYRSETESDRSKARSRSDKYERIKRSVERSDSSDNEDDSPKRKKGYKLSSSSDSSRGNSSDSSDEDDDQLSKRIKQLLKKDKDSSSPESESSSSSSSSSRYSRNRTKPEKNEVFNKEAPSLRDLENQGVYQQKKVMRDLNQTSYSEQNEDDLKRELLFKFDILKKSYNSVQIPEFSIHSDYQSMLKSYEMTVKKVTLDSNVDNYKTYLIYGFMGVEFVLSNFFKFDMQGFTQQQIVNMGSYDKLLIELGEKSYIPKASSWPVEVRLLFTILIQAGFFVLTKMLMKKTGANLLGMINGMNSPPPAPSTGGSKRKMKGPDLDLIPDL